MDKKLLVNNSKNQSDVDDQSEISIIDILRFLKGEYKIIAAAGVTGIILSLAYLVITPNQYQATAQIAMAQLGSDSNNLSSVVNIEEPTLLVARMALPTSFTQESIVACGFEGKPEAGATLAKAIKLTPLKGVINVIEIRTFGNSPRLAKDCANAVFEVVKNSQYQIAIPFNEMSKQKLIEEKTRLQVTQEFLRSNKSAQIDLVYLSSRDELIHLFNKISSLNDALANNQNRVTRLITPIYANNAPISPKKHIALAAGLIGGLCLGLMIALGKRMIAKHKSAAQGLE